jgi:hypothetical protein
MNTKDKENLALLSSASNIRTFECKVFKQIPLCEGLIVKDSISTITYNFSLQNIEPFGALAAFLNNDDIKNSPGEIYYASRGIDGTLHSIKIDTATNIIETPLINLIPLCQSVFDAVELLSSTPFVPSFHGFISQP